jgi:hypothetical protein
MAGFETLDIFARLISQAMQDPTLAGLFPTRKVQLTANFAPREPPAVYVVATLTTEHETNVTGGERAFGNASIMLEAAGRETGLDILGPIMVRLDAIVTDENFPGVTNGTYVGRFIRTNTITRATAVDNIRWFYLAGVYDTIAYSV